MNKFLLKDNEIMIFTDFNNTLVDFENEYNSIMGMYNEKLNQSTVSVKSHLTRCLREFEQKTELKPVICVVTNASLFSIDGNDAPGIHQDLHMTFFNHTDLSEEKAREMYDYSCEKYFKYLLYKENDCFFEINPLGNSLDDMFVPHLFDENALRIKYAPNFKKRESVERMMTLIDPEKLRTKFCIFAGDSIKDDYPMKLAETAEGVCKIFIRPGKVQKMKKSLMHEFCVAKGVEFSSVHPKTGKVIKCFDEDSVKWLSADEKNMLDNFDDGDHVILTSKNSRGLIEGLYQSIDIINSVRNTNANTNGFVG